MYKNKKNGKFRGSQEAYHAGMGNSTVMSLYILQEPDSKGFCQDYIYKNYKDFFF